MCSASVMSCGHSEASGILARVSGAGTPQPAGAFAQPDLAQNISKETRSNDALAF
jgi:hypothetical protein